MIVTFQDIDDRNNVYHAKFRYTPAFTTAEVICTKIKANQSIISIFQIYRSPSTDKSTFTDEAEPRLVWLNKAE